ncbi:hypothetical protein BGW37DRAFT_508640 [Umbelopsis sp. PMI_123]|nr:hypothetical protein BGW37DRAFT_508640 [Umbelopsis sp. PMI_123]
MLMTTKSDHHHFQNAADVTRTLQKQSYGTSKSDRPLSDLINCSSKIHRTVRPSSDIVQAADIYRHSLSPEAEAIDHWCENLQHYEQTVEAMATSKLDQKFKDDLNRVNEWFRLLCEAERTTALYSIVQHATQVQIRFLIAVLTKMANQDPLGALLSPGPNQDKDPFLPSSVKQSELELQQRMRSVYPLRNKLASRNMYRQSNAFSEPDDYTRRRQYDLLAGRTLGLTDSGILYEKAMALKQATGIRTSTVGNNSILNSSFIKSPRLPQPVKRPDSSTSLSNQSSVTSPSPITDWPYAFQKNDSSSFVGNTSARSSLADTSSTNSSTIGGHSSSNSSDALSEWSPLLAPKNQQQNHHHQQDQEIDQPSIYDNKWSPGGKKLEPSNHEQSETTTLPLRASKPVLSTIDTMHPSIFNSPQQSKLLPDQKSCEDLLSLPTPDDPKPTSNNAATFDTNMGLDTRPPSLPIKYNRRMSNSTSTPTGHRYSPLLSPLPSPKSHSRSSNRSTSPPFRAWPPSPAANSKSNYAQFLNPHDAINLPEYLSDHSDGSESSHAETVHLTEAAMNRRRRASAARAAKDKIAAETVDFDLMQDVQAWLRTLRLHKYSYAFEGLTWQQVVRMTDEDMTQAGVNTIGARRKLLKVFENVMNHCQKNGMQY